MTVILAKVARIEDHPNSGQAVATIIGENFSGKLVVNSCDDRLRYETPDGFGVRLGTEFRLEVMTIPESSSIQGL